MYIRLSELCVAVVSPLPPTNSPSREGRIQESHQIIEADKYLKQEKAQLEILQPDYDHMMYA